MTTRFSVLAIWATVAVVLLLLPQILSAGSSISMMNLMGIMIIFALSYNMLYGQTGLLSFGHAVYYGLAGYVAIHVMNVIVGNRYPVPLVAIPLVGGLAGLAFSILFGWFSTKRASTAFAMITLGLAELVVALSLIVTVFFGGEDGIGTNRAKLLPVFGWRFGPQIQVYYLIAGWCFLSMAAMYFFTRTPFGRICNAVRDNAERVEFVGFDARMIRYTAFCASGFFAGIAGSLSAVNFEIMNVTSLAGAQSGSLLLMTYIGGTGQFFGPIIGAVLITLLRIMLSDYTDAWLMYYGLFFVLAVMYMPGGISGWLTLHWPLVRHRVIGTLLRSYLLVSIPMLLALAGVIMLLEMSYRILGNSPTSKGSFRLLGWVIDGKTPTPWLFSSALFLGGCWLIWRLWPAVTEGWAVANARLHSKAGEA